MRIFVNYEEALNEIKRDLAEMGIPVHPHSMQNKNVKDNPDYATKEIQNYAYTVLNAIDSIDQLNPTQPWADAEFLERIDHKRFNPGEAYKLRPDIWDEFLVEGKFDYTYNERMAGRINLIIKEIKRNPDSRQLYLGIWDNIIDIHRIGGGWRIPCSLGYLFQVRNNQLNITYTMRSCDYSTHMENDIYLATKLLWHVADKVDIKPGNFTHFVNSLHIYAKDVEGVF